MSNQRLAPGILRTTVTADQRLPAPDLAAAFRAHPHELAVEALKFYYAEHMAKGNRLGELEHIVLLAVLRLGDEAYGVPIRSDIEQRTGRSLTVGALYRTLDRLEDKGYLQSWLGDPTPERGGRSKRYFRLRPLGIATLRASREALTAMWDGLEPLVTRGS
jgi:PadR family transcriptional regulator, regulatory protein PadR